FIHEIEILVTQCRQLCDEIDFEEISIIEQEIFSTTFDSLSNKIDELIFKFHELDTEERKNKKDNKEPFSDTNIYGSDIQYFRNLDSAIHEFSRFIDSKKVTLSNTPFLIV